jgi:hypothetical protein
VTLCTPPFRSLAFRRRESLGLAALPVVFLPHPMMTRTPAEIEEIADQALDEVVKSLTG